jgi:hypothetical protein
LLLFSVEISSRTLKMQRASAPLEDPGRGKVGEICVLLGGCCRGRSLKKVVTAGEKKANPPVGLRKGDCGFFTACS